MEHFYFDSSALVKRYVAENGTDWMNQLCAIEAGNTLYTVRISGAEIIAALFRRARTGALDGPDVQAAYSDEIDHVFRPCRPPVGAKRR